MFEAMDLIDNKAWSVLDLNSMDIHELHELSYDALSQMEAGTEGLAKVAKRIFRKSLDRMMFVSGNLIKALPGVNDKELVIQRAMRANRMSLKKLKKMRYQDVANVKVATAAFNERPVAVSADLITHYNELNCIKNVEKANEVLGKITPGKRENASLVKEVALMANFDRTIKATEWIESVTTLKKTIAKSTPFGDYYDSISEFVSVTEQVLENSNIAMDAKVLLDQVKQNSIEIRRLMDRFEHEQNVKNLKQLPKAVYNLALCIETHGQLVRQFHFLDTNLSKTLTALSKHI